MGKVLLAHSDAATIGKVLRRKLKAYTPNTITDGKRLRAELNTVARQGYAVDREEITRGLVCVAAPIYGIDGDVEAAISCTVSSFDADKEFLEQVREHVTHCAEAASN
jgi:DNA-binding IclR family transcriptional regulator